MRNAECGIKGKLRFCTLHQKLTLSVPLPKFPGGRFREDRLRNTFTQQKKIQDKINCLESFYFTNIV